MKIPVYLNETIFRRFTMFDIFRRRKMWRAPVTFASILVPCSAVCFYMNHVDGAVMLGCVLLIVGLGMPITYFANFFLSLNKQVSHLGLKTPKLVYTLELTEAADGIGVENGKEKASYKWKQAHHAYRDEDATYLFITPQRAFLLPHKYVQADIEEMWWLITRKLSPARCTDLRK